MSLVFVKDLSHATDLEERLAFRAPLFEAASGDVRLGELTWDAPVEVLERGPVRSRVRTGDGRVGFVQERFLVRVRWVDRRGSGRDADWTTPLYRRATGSSKHFDLLWGDRVQVLDDEGSRVRVRARGRWGWVTASALTERPLLELYFIDVGQGDGVLIRTPDGRHLLVDGGYTRSKQPTGKSAADFVDWKFFKDYDGTRIVLDAMIASHCDADHYGGLWDLVDPRPSATGELDCETTEVRAFYHAGVSWWRPGQRWLGPTVEGHLVDLLGDRDSVLTALADDANPKLQGEWSFFLEALVERTTVVERLGSEGPHDERYLPGFGPGDDVSIRVLGPVTRRVGSSPAVRDLGSDSRNTNGHSIVLRLDHGRARILMTGDLNRASQQRLLEAYAPSHHLFACDVGKGCHHGSEDVSYRFLQAVHPAATIISSGDNEGHGHPRPTIVAASALTGFVSLDTTADELLTPVVYATEVERSIGIGRMVRIDGDGYPHADATLDVRLWAVDADRLDGTEREDALLKRETVSRVAYEETPSGALRPSKRTRGLKDSWVVSGIVYGLVNVRTDGEWIVCATRNEGDHSWNVKAFPARFG